MAGGQVSGSTRKKMNGYLIVSSGEKFGSLNIAAGINVEDNINACAFSQNACALSLSACTSSHVACALSLYVCTSSQVVCALSSSACSSSQDVCAFVPESFLRSL